MHALTLAAFCAFLGLTSAASGLRSGAALPGGGWAGWQCLTPEDGPHCRVPVFVQLNASGQGERRQQVPESRTFGPVLRHPNGRTLYLGGFTLVALDSATLKARWSVALSGPSRETEPLALSPDGRFLAVAARNGAVRLLSTQSGQTTQTLHHPFYTDQQNGYGDFFAAPTALAFAPDGRSLAIGSRGGGVRVRALGSGQERQLTGSCAGRQTAHRGPVRGLVFAGAGTLVSAANDGRLVVWSLAGAAPVRCLSLPGGVTSLHTLPHGRLLALGVTSGTLLQPGVRRLARLAPLASEITQWQVTGTTLALSDQHSTRRWNLPSGAPLPSTAPALATLRTAGATVAIGDDLRVRVQVGGQTRVLSPPVTAPGNLDGSGLPIGWQARLTGNRLTVKATSNIRVMTMETADFTNEYVWAWPSGRFLSCRTLRENGFTDDPDRACTSARRALLEP
ncbi:WD40 repeat domain-containing protein [Deinococcus arcticus]|uniref:Anaphase-promoting complex subunit 4-like WD40 domain-containing protein n=1 Tax=Deinococcus arcticus TaxID=2136176 RepID=A0A2T3WAP7_9DEIO|nr:PQQ-binding-like beta-propeller repeat protein [Deinococcus arcticus]PTA68917.1 hypothetical protein C8263_03680 [Deinococcus arcticus]